MQAALCCIFISPAQRFNGQNQQTVGNRLSETMFQFFCYDWPEPTPADRIKADRGQPGSPPDLRRISARHPLDLRRISAGYPPDIRRISAGYPPDIRRMRGGQPCRLRPAVTKIRKRSFVEAVYRSFSILTFKT